MTNLARQVLEALVEHHELVAWVKRNYVATESNVDRVWLRDVTDHAVIDFDAIRSAQLGARLHRAMTDAGFRHKGVKGKLIRFYRVRRV